eukprot:jgi/Mesvir1/27171/Mv20831-RA.1
MASCARSAAVVYKASAVAQPKAASASFHVQPNSHAVRVASSKAVTRFAVPQARSTASCYRLTTLSASIQFVKGINEPVIPDVKLTRARDGSSGTATFLFENPSVFEASNELGEITGLYLIDEEGTVTSVDVNAKFVNGKPSSIEAKLVMRSPYEWDRFMRFMERYAKENELGFSKS